MPLQTFNPPRPPAPGTLSKPEYKILEAEFGDGYSQPTPDGLNHIRRTISLEWENLTPIEANQILNFIIAHKGVTPFYYTPSDETTPIKWTCKEHEDARTKGGLRTVTLMLREDFTLEE
jgi:phage-related protein